MSQLKEIIPQFYSHLFEKDLLSTDVTETKATCHNCLRSRDRRFEYLYQAHLKCCTFFPFVPNFAAGGIIHHQLKGAEVIKNKIQKREFSLPLGIFPTLKFQYEFMNREYTDFGNREDLLCPYFDKESLDCQIWQFRGVVCTTYYCTSNKGKAGQTFWRFLSDYLSYVEMALSEECLVQLDFSPRDLSDQLSFLNRTEWESVETIKEVLDAKEFKSFWNGYDQYEKFYLKCYDLVCNLSKKEFKEILGSHGYLLLENVYKNTIKS